MEPATTEEAGEPAERRSDRRMAGAALARSKKKAVREGWELVFVDESGFYLLPGVVRTWAPRGETPVLRARLTRDHVSVISGITPAGELYTTMQDHAFTSSDCVRFLKHLRRQIGRKRRSTSGAIPAIRTRVEPGRRHLAAPEVCGASQSVLRDTRRTQTRNQESSRTHSTTFIHRSGLHRAAGNHDELMNGSVARHQARQSYIPRSKPGQRKHFAIHLASSSRPPFRSGQPLDGARRLTSSICGRARRRQG